MTSRKKTALALASGAAVLALVGGILAYFGASDQEPNLIGVGKEEIAVTEVFTPPGQTQDYVYRKLVKIGNTGSVPCYIRVRLEFSDSDVQSAASFSADEADAPADSTFFSADIHAADAYISHLPDGWVYVKEQGADDPTAGYYYYTSPVAPDSSTAALISWVKMHYGNADAIQAHDVYVYAESVQTVDPNSGAAYADWKAAWKKFTG
ncbi:MAG: hypothetical protein II916_01045 [Oscillospiraceae bacterium]|nr:hypothetical protein [Oscillospiraceae bacterium]